MKSSRRIESARNERFERITRLKSRRGRRVAVLHLHDGPFVPVVEVDVAHDGLRGVQATRQKAPEDQEPACPKRSHGAATPFLGGLAARSLRATVFAPLLAVVRPAAAMVVRPVAVVAPRGLLIRRSECSAVRSDSEPRRAPGADCSAALRTVVLHQAAGPAWRSALLLRSDRLFGGLLRLGTVGLVVPVPAPFAALVAALRVETGDAVLLRSGRSALRPR